MLKLKRSDNTKISKWMLNIRLQCMSVCFLKLNMTVEHASRNKYLKLHVGAHLPVMCQKID